MKTSYKTIENNALKITFPNDSKIDKCDIKIAFHKTLRIPDDNKKYPLPPNLGNFELSNIDDYDKVSPQWKEHGGIFMPIHQSEAMWISFHSRWPFAVKIASGKINAVSGEKWTNKLEGKSNDRNHQEQDYIIVPSQPWIDGFNVGKGVIRQFVAVPLDSGYTVEEQLSGSAEHGGIQIMVFPMKKSEYEKQFKHRSILRSSEDHYKKSLNSNTILCSASASASSDMGLGAGGFMKQEIYEDKYGIEVWEKEGERVFVHLLNSKQYKHITGKEPHSKPLNAGDYKAHHYPWFDYYSLDNVISGSDKLSSVKSVQQLKTLDGKKVKDKSFDIGDNIHLINKKNIIDKKW